MKLYGKGDDRTSSASLLLFKERSCRLLEVDLFWLGQFGLGAFFLALDQEIDGLGRFFGLFGGLGGQFLAERAIADRGKFDPVDDDDHDDREEQTP